MNGGAMTVVEPRGVEHAEAGVRRTRRDTRLAARAARAITRAKLAA